MAQNDMNIANQGFPAFRADLNDQLEALVTNSSGATAPATTFPHQWWLDTSTTPSTLRQRNAANDGWVVIGLVDQSANKLILSNPEYTGTLTGGTGVINIGSGQLYKDASGAVGVGTSSPVVNRRVTIQNATDGSTASALYLVANYGNINDTTGIDMGGVAGNPFAAIRQVLTNAVNGASALALYTSPDGTAPIERMRIDSAGTLILNQGQIQFPATQNASANANTLDDYEEGTWTPTLPNGGTISVASGTAATYTKIGRQVTVLAYVSFSSIPNNASRFDIGGLPFVSGSLTVSPFGAGSISYSAFAVTNDLGGSLAVGGGTSLYWHFLTGSPAAVSNANVVSKALDTLIFSHTYFTN